MLKKKIFVIQHHFSKKPHFDLRLELDGVLKSWAVPKEPPIESGTKRLAIQVDDHALSYAKFEGTIEEGYGKGTVKIWDYGTYEMESQKEKKMVFVLNGKKLKGKYVLLRFEKAKNGWLLFKKDDI